MCRLRLAFQTLNVFCFCGCLAGIVASVVFIHTPEALPSIVIAVAFGACCIVLCLLADSVHPDTMNEVEAVRQWERYAPPVNNSGVDYTDHAVNAWLIMTGRAIASGEAKRDLTPALFAHLVSERSATLDATGRCDW